MRISFKVGIAVLLLALALGAALLALFYFQPSG